MITGEYNFFFEQKEEDGTLSLMDLPKECLINILKKLEKPRDIINVALTCSTLEVIAMDTEVWESMCFHHFNDKEICDYVGHMELYSVNWVEVFKFCLKWVNLQLILASRAIHILCSYLKEVNFIDKNYYIWRHLWSFIIRKTIKNCNCFAKFNVERHTMYILVHTQYSWAVFFCKGWGCS